MTSRTPKRALSEPVNLHSDADTRRYAKEAVRVFLKAYGSGPSSR
ncbi:MULTISPECIES: hypothetical protein [Sinorhizobium]|nr:MULTISPECIES: hypothetical protein [Sinorhizobium]